MFSAILLILAGFVGAAFQLVRPFIEVNQEDLPSLFTDDIPFYTLTLCLATITAGVLSLLRQAALFAYLGALFGIASLGVFGLVPGLALLAIAMMVKSHLEGEETRDDDVQVDASMWPDKALASSLFMVVVGSIAITQGVLMLAGNFDPIVLTGRRLLAGSIGLAVGLLCLVAARQVYHLRTPWLGWVALALGLATMGFYLIGPVMAVTGMVLLALAHREDEFLLHGSATGDLAPSAPARRRGRRRLPG